MVTTRPNIDKLAATCGMYIDDFYRLCKFHKLSTGRLQDFHDLAEGLNSRPSFRSDFFRLAALIRRKEEGGMAVEDLITIVALALGAPEIRWDVDFTVPLNYVEIFTAGLLAEDERIERQLNQFDPLEANSPADARSAPIEARYFNSPGPVEPQNDRSEVQLPHGLARQEETEALERIEWMAITIEHRLKAIEAFMNNIASHANETASGFDWHSATPSDVPLTEAAAPDARLADNAVRSQLSTFGTQTDHAGVQHVLPYTADEFFGDIRSTPQDIQNELDSTTVRTLSAILGPKRGSRFYLLSGLSLLISILLIVEITSAGHSHADIKAPHAAHQGLPPTKVHRESDAQDPLARRQATISVTPKTRQLTSAAAQARVSTEALHAPGLDRRVDVRPTVSVADASHAPLPPTPPMQQEATEKMAVIQTLSAWAQAARSNDVAGEISYYAPLLDRYFLRRSVSREFVQQDKKSYRQRGNLVQRFDISDLRFTFASNDAVMVSLSKSWSVVGPSNSSERIRTTKSRLWLSKTSQGWKIVGEQDLTS